MIRTLRYLMCAIIFVATATGPSVAPGQTAWPAQLDSVLAALELSRATARFDRATVAQWGGDRFVNRRFQRLHADPWVLPGDITHEAAAVGNVKTGLFELLRLASLRTDAAVYRDYIINPAARYRALVDSSDTPLLDALQRLYEAADTRFLPAQEATFRKEAGKLRPEVRLALACFTHAYADFLGSYRIALRKVASEESGLRKVLPLRDPGISGIFRMLTSDEEPWASDPLAFVQLYDFVEQVDLGYLYMGALDLAAVCDYMADSLARLSTLVDDDFIWDTPCGRIAVSTDADHTYEARKKYLLIVDAGGNDTYHTGGASINTAYHSGVIIDRAGNDTYITDSTLSVGIGGALLGVALVYDLGGDDTYDAGSRSLGSATLGMAGLWDAKGHDSYRGRVSSQGAAAYGVGVLFDYEGDDRYLGLHQVQGFGFTRGCGLLYDRTGDDVYIADDSNLVYPSPQTAEHNVSWAQGAASGYRAPHEHDHAMAGGIGYLVDGGGNDRYSAGLFAQGCAYWYAYGMLADLAGDDAYDGIWYVQGAGAHFAVGALYDATGVDTYTATMNMAQGAGHDFTVGFLWDGAGNDRYMAPSLSLGAANANGIGIFRDDGGDDTYVVDAPTALGRSNSTGPGALRFDLLSLGIFLDTGGRDTYPSGRESVRDGSLWIQSPPQDPASPHARGAGIDSGTEP